MNLPETPAEHHVVVLGASPKPSRPANMAVKILKDKGYLITPIHPRFESIEGIDAISDLSAVQQPIHTLTLYVGPDGLMKQLGKLIGCSPGRVIFNPGTESAEVQRALDAAEIAWENACTLVLLKTDQF